MALTEEVLRMIDPKWLFQNYKTYQARIEVLEYMLDELDNNAIDDNSIIEMIVYRRDIEKSVHPIGYRGNSTEYTALNLDQLRRESNEEIAAMVKRWKDERGRLKLLVHLHNAAMNAMSDEERKLIKLHYEDGYTLEELEYLPLTNRASGSKSRSTIIRMLRTITEKSTRIMNLTSFDL